MRLTEKKESYIKELKTNGRIYFVDDILPSNCKLTSRSIDKLGQLEDIEEELGIDLVTIFKILKQRTIFIPFIYDNNGKLLEVVPVQIIGINQDSIVYESVGGCIMTKNIKDYGKSYALTKGELQ